MGKESLDYRLLSSNIQPDDLTFAVIIHSAEVLVTLMSELGQKGEPKIVVDNNTISMRTPTSKMVTAAGYVPGGNALYLYSPTAPSIRIPLPKPLEEMTQEELLQITDKPVGYINSQLIKVLRDYAIERPD